VSDFGSEAAEQRAARARLAAAADDDRRDIERALHGGVQQELVALGVRLQLLRRYYDSDRTAALDVLDELERDVHDALDSVRALSERIYPAILPLRGVPDALRAAASIAGISARVESDCARYPARLETAVYFCCRELIEGAVVSPRVTMHGDGDELRFEVTGESVDADVAFVHITRVRDRIEALGGELTVTMELARTHIAGRVPIYEAASAR
jgi:signal transduction histidine kinase